MAGGRTVSHGMSMTDASTPTSGKKSQKRKRELDGSGVPSATPTKKSKTSESTASTPASAKAHRKSKKQSEPSPDDRHKKSTKKKSSISPVSSKATTPIKSDRIKQTKKKSKEEKRRPAGDDIDTDEAPPDLRESTDDSDHSEGSGGVENGKRSKRQSQDSKSASVEVQGDSNPTKNKFSGILSKFERSAKVKEAAAAKGYRKDEKPDTDTNLAEPVVAQGLEPIPQPEIVPEQDEKPTYSSLPPWLAYPLRTSSETRTKFSDLGIDPNLLRVLEGNGYKEAFAVQSAVIPLLLKGSKSHPGDVCVSAATGSGKTLSYVLPLVAELEQVPAPRLRGLIAVPTRELVKQAREACELCAAGSGLRVGSAVGNVAIKDEQRSLMRVDQIYSPETVLQRRKAELTGDDWTNFNLQDYIANATDLDEPLPGYINRAEPNVDILICTPGRLVDHIRYTKGFTLKHLQWLVIDEADRLLNESFQEWVDVVINSLDARRAVGAFGPSGEFLTKLGLPLQIKEPRKVILSATMTRDISKLNSLRLTNPKLVIVGSSEPTGATKEDSSIIAHSDDKFTLPSTLREYSVSVGDGSQKPLYLLRLLLSHIKLDIPQAARRRIPEISESEDTSSDETSSDDSSSEDSSSDESSSEGSSSGSESSDSESESESDALDDFSSSSDDSETSSESESEEPTKPSSKPNPLRNTVLVFTKSSESASRLSRLISLLNPSLADRIGTIIKSNKSSASRKTLAAYRHGKLSIIIATDRASRGLDLQSLMHVVNYDVPTSVTTYVHRVGRTARAGKEGSAWTLVAHREGRWFTNEISKGSNGKITRSTKVERVPIKLDNMKELKSKYATALDVLEKEVRTGGTKKSG